MKRNRKENGIFNWLEWRKWNYKEKWMRAEKKDWRLHMFRRGRKRKKKSGQTEFPNKQFGNQIKIPSKVKMNFLCCMSMVISFLQSFFFVVLLFISLIWKLKSSQVHNYVIRVVIKLMVFEYTAFGWRDSFQIHVR